MNKSITRLWRERPDNSTMAPIEASILPQTSTLTAPSAQISRNDERAPAPRQSNGEPKPKRRKGNLENRKEQEKSASSNIRLDQLGGMDETIGKLLEAVVLPMKLPRYYLQFGIQPTRGILLYGPPGSGKTIVAEAFAVEIGETRLKFSAPSLVAGVSGETEKRVRDIFEEAKKQAPCVLIIDEIDAILGKRENASREMERRVVAQFLTCMDELTLDKTDGKPVVLIATTNSPNSIDSAMRRAGRFDIEINLRVPDEATRILILRSLTQKVPLTDDEYSGLGRLTPGFVGADLKDAVTKAANKKIYEFVTERALASSTAISANAGLNISPELAKLRSVVAYAGEQFDGCEVRVTYEEYVDAIRSVQPALKREGFTEIPETTWEHIGALREVRDQLNMAIVGPIKRPENFARVGIAAPGGVLLWGPPGCGKTLLAKAVAKESNANFISVKGPEMLNMYVGESERSIRQLFERARSCVPCIIFFDELDSLVPKRGRSQSDTSTKVVNTLLTELDGLSSRAGIYVIAATNRRDMIDGAMLRPGRLGTSIFVGLPTADERVEILSTLIRKAIPSATEEFITSLRDVARDSRADGFSGADLAQLHLIAGHAALKRELEEENELVRGVRTEVRYGLQGVDWQVALDKVKPSVRDMGPYRQSRSQGL